MIKKSIALLLTAVLCLGLVGCSAGSEAEKYEKYETLIEYLEAGDYDSAIAEIDRLSESDEGEGSQGSDGQGDAGIGEQTIEITLDNWQEYFEFNEYLSVSYFTNAFDEATETNLGLYTILEPKEEYSDYVADVAIEYDMDYRICDIVYNLDDFSFELIECVSHPDKTVDESEFIRGGTSGMYGNIGISRDRIVDGKVVNDAISYDGYDRRAVSFSFRSPQTWGTTIVNNDDGTGYISQCPTNIQITRIEGTLEYKG